MSLLITIAAGVLCTVAIRGAQQAPEKTTWDGIYTEAQAKRGGDHALKECSLCHGDKLTGTDIAPSLTGVFLDNYANVGDLFERIRTTMPQDRPGELTREVCADILAHIFGLNKFPAGEVELGTTTEALKHIRIERKKP